MRNSPGRSAEYNPPKDSVLLQFDKRDAEIVRNWSKTALTKDLAENKTKPMFG